METKLLCPNCRAENLPNAKYCYRCNTVMPSAPAWVGPMKFKAYDAAKDKPSGWVAAAFGSVIILVSSFLAWLGVPKSVTDADSRGTSPFDILIGSTGSKSAIGNGGVGSESVGFDVRILVLAMMIAALVVLALAVFRPLFVPMLVAAIIALIVPIYFFVTLAVRNSATFNTPDLVGLLRIGFYGSIIGAVIMLFGAIGCRRYALTSQ